MRLKREAEAQKRDQKNAKRRKLHEEVREERKIFLKDVEK